ncbi:serine-type D-Ala-D-Ala carboxypeptidase [Vibrio algarum]|uniref:Serine-type D-Ala-D-Ala carboxypeptidase n=1 Tax=Vibrio algarum TaxID=3020714 RepID=A0ABT4YNG4_9VIBR|nr:serine-type D-Ala-D-Ala carboxypeptidase [Vibrio sp. KJ40-1]MDB1123084.1 serine-type D-Ala-D-Ala carboxypeptidase [Vibrio sp. KJ40-1]
MRVFITFLCIGFSFYVSAYEPINSLPTGSRVSLLVKNPTETALSINTKQLFPPASTLKIITALAAKLELGDDFRFETQLEQKNKDIVIRFSGDPTLKTQDLDNLFKQASNQGIKSIEGNIWLNDSIFTGYERAVGWPWDILGVCYSAPSSAITLDGNCVQASIYTNSDGSTRAHVPEHQPIIVTNDVITVTKEVQKERQCQLELLTSDNNNYHLSGCLISQKKPLPLKFAVQDTQEYTSSIIKNLLAKHRISFSGNIASRNDIQGTPIATHLSAPLNDLVESMLKSSNNLIADNITKTLGARFYSQPGSFNNGTEAIKQIIFSNSRINLSASQFADGSGLSRNNRMTAEDMNKILEYIWKNESTLGVIKILPKSGETGTLKYRRSMRQVPIKGQLQAKSGSVYGSYNMAGYVLNGNGQPKSTFVQFISDYFPKKEESESNSLSPLFKFEKAFYQDLIKLSPKNSSLQ